MQKLASSCRACDRRVWAIGMSVGLIVGCSGGTSPSGGTDAATSFDAGSGLDGGPGSDVGPGVDAAPGLDVGAGVDTGVRPSDTGPRVDACMPQCSGRACGNDPACGTSCGTCPTGQHCTGNSCFPDCPNTCVAMGRVCGTDACGHSCGPTCPGTQHCNATGHCVATCVPTCDGTSCGTDGCGGRCTCVAHSTCQPSTDCNCDTGYVADPTLTHCIPAGGNCTTYGVSANGFCAGTDTWIYCDPRYGIQAVSCSGFGFGACHDFGGGVGACTCAGGGDRCAGVGASATYWNLLLACNTFTSPNSVFAVNCEYRNPSGHGHCATFATAFGTQASCMCNACDPFYSSSFTCDPFPPCSGAGCAVTSGTTMVPPLEACL